MKSDINGLLKTVETAIEGLKNDTADKEFTPQLGTALGGLRTAREGLASHLALKPGAEKNTGKQN